MKEISAEQVISMLEKEELGFYNIFNTDLDIQQMAALDYYIKNPNDDLNIDQKLSKVFLDIEVFTNFAGEKSLNSYEGIINCITLFDNINNEFNTYFLINKKHDEKQIKSADFKTELVENKYIKNEYNIKVHIFNNEEKLITSCWEKIRELDPAVLSGFYCEFFDIPYIYNRLKRIYFGDENKVNSIFSRFSKVSIRKTDNGIIYHIPEYSIMDIQRLYKPRSEGGLNYGKSLGSYSLDYISEVELKLKKLEYKNEGMSLDEFYNVDPINFIKYNIIDVALTVKLDEKLKHIDLHNMLRRDMKCPMSSSLIGPSSLFTSLITYELMKDNKYVRFGILNESVLEINETDISKIELPKDNKMTWDVKKIDEKTFRSVLTKYPGAYVKDPKPTILSLDDGILVDLDATSLYPSIMLQNNVSFDTYFGRVIDPLSYKIINIIRNKKITESTISNQKSIVFKMISDAVEYIEPQNKGKYKQYMYFMYMYLIKNIINNIDNIVYKPINVLDYLFLKSVFIPFIDLNTEIVKRAEYNSFAYDFIINNDIDNYDTIFIIENESDFNIEIKEIKAADFNNYLKEKELCFSLSGALFYKHEKKVGLFTDFIERRMKLRKFYKKERDKFDVGTKEYDFYDRRQHAMKINVNSIYGLTGMNTFLYSNKNLASTVTLGGRLMLKVAQYCAEAYLETLNKKES